MKPEDSRATRGMAQDLVHWLWAFFFWILGLSSILTARIAPQRWPAVLARVVLFAVGGAALLVCSLTIWRELRRWYGHPKAPPTEALTDDAETH